MEPPKEDTVQVFEPGSNLSHSRQTPIPEPMDIEEPISPRSNLRLIAILVALYLALFIAALDATIVATAIPTITASLHSSSGYFWIGSAYLLANAAAAPIWAKCSDIWGRKIALLGCVLIFTSASILAALSTSMRMLIAGRALQGSAGGGLVQMVNITISDLFSPRKRTLYLGLTEMIWAFAGGLGPILGGAFTELVNWRWIFWINLPVCGTTFVLLFFFLNVHNPRTRLREGMLAIDWFGTISILAVTLLLLLGLDFGGAIFPWSSPKVICLIVFGTLMIGFFLFSEKKLAKYPLMPLGMFKHWSNNAAFAVCFCHGMAFIVAEYYLPLYFQAVKQASPLRSGVLILPITVSEGLTGIVAGFIMHKTGRYRELTWIGMTIFTIGTGLYIHLGTSSSVGEIVAFELIEGIGSGFLFVAPLIALHSMVSQSDTATATATFGFIRNMAMSTAIVLGGAVFQNGMDARTASLHAVGLNQTLVSAFSNGEAAANVELIRTISNISKQNAVKDAFSWSLRNMWITFTCIAAIGLAMSVFLKHKDLSSEHTETRTGIEEMTKREGATEQRG